MAPETPSTVPTCSQHPGRFNEAGALMAPETRRTRSVTLSPGTQLQ